MKKRAIDCKRAVVTHHQASEIPQPGVGGFHDPSPPVTPQRSAILRRGPNAIPFMRADQFDPSLLQALPQGIAVIRLVGNHPHRFLSRMARPMKATYADRRQRRFREPDFRRGCRVKVVSQRKTAAVDHHHPLRPLAPLGFSDSAAPFFAGAKLPSRNDSLHFNCWRSFSLLRNARQIFNQTPCSSQSRNRRQQVEGCGNFSGKSCQRAPLRRIQRIPSNTRRFSIHGRPPLRCLGGRGSKGANRSIWRGKDQSHAGGESDSRWLSTAASTSFAKSRSMVAVESSGSSAMHSEMVRAEGMDLPALVNHARAEELVRKPDLLHLATCPADSRPLGPALRLCVQPETW